MYLQFKKKEYTAAYECMYTLYNTALEKICGFVLAPF